VSGLPFDSGLNYFDLEDPAHIERLRNPKLALEGLRGLVVIDEIQLRPELFPVLRVLVDREKVGTRFLIPFGSDTPKLASALRRLKMRHGKSIYPQAAQCVGADVPCGLCGEVSTGGYEFACG